MVQEKHIFPVIAIPIHKLFVFLHHWYSHIEKLVMSKASQLLKPLMPILSAVYGVAIIYVAALPVGGDHPGFMFLLLLFPLFLQ